MRPYDTTAAVVEVPCEHCGAPAGFWCERPNGNYSPWQHAARYAAIQDLEKAARQ